MNKRSKILQTHIKKMPKREGVGQLAGPGRCRVGVLSDVVGRRAFGEVETPSGRSCPPVQLLNPFGCPPPPAWGGLAVGLEQARPKSHTHATRGRECFDCTEQNASVAALLHLF